MSGRTILALAVAGTVGAALVPAVVRLPRPRTENHRGTSLPVTLGVALVAATIAGTAVSAFDGIPGSVIAGLLLVAFAGMLDDLLGSDARGIRAHLGSLVRGRFTTGILKILAGFAAALLAVLALGGSPTRQLVGVVLIAAGTNLANVLDVAPGRLLKLFLPVQAVALAGLWGHPGAVLAGAGAGAAAGVLAADLRERGMLGDGGSNPVGYVAGVALYQALPLWALGVALGLVLVLQVLAETITLSRVIAAVPPLRAYDRLGRVGPTKSSPKSGEAS